MTIERSIDIGVTVQEAERLWERCKNLKAPRLSESEERRIRELTLALTISNTRMLLEIIRGGERDG